MSDYKILSVIGKGAFGDAYLGLNTKQNKQYVIKQVQIKNKSKQQTDHIYHQVKLLQQFNHINIVSYRDSFIDKKGLLNIVMQYCEGGDMNQYIETLQGNKIEEDKIVYWMAQIALAIFYMHEKKILHRDLKSPNIFILKGNIRLGDFGISKVLDHVRDLAQTNIGTPYYMSPEQYNHKPYSYKSDIWAFGCILYEMCNQRRPFQANNIQALGMKVVRGNFPPVSECYSKDLRSLIGEMLSKNPAKRPNIIEILLKPFIKKKLVEYMKKIYTNKQELSKQSLSSFIQQSKKLGISLEENKQNKSAVISKPISVNEESLQKQRSTSTNRNRNKEEQKQKQRVERDRKKEQLQKQLKQHNKQRKEMAEKLKKIQQERKNLLSRKKSEKSLKAINEKVQAANVKGNLNQQKQYQSQKYTANSLSRSKLQPKADLQHKKAEETQKNKTKQSNNKQKSAKSTQRTTTIYKKSTRKISPAQTPTSTDKKNNKKQIIEEIQQVMKNKWLKQPEKTFKMEEEYEMEFEDCQPEGNQYQQNYYDEFEQYQQSQKHVDSQGKLRLPTFANDENILAKQVQYIKNLVFQSNQAVKQLTKNKQNSKQNMHIHPITQVNHSNQQDHVIVSLVQKSILNEQQKTIVCEKIQQKVQKMKQQIKMKTQHINFIRNQLSNIDFELSDSDQDNRDKAGAMPFIGTAEHNFSKKKQYNPQHTKINDRINTLKQSAMTILGTEKFNKFYEYLLNITQKGRTVKRQYLQVVIGKQKIGSYHLVEQIVRLSRVLQKIPKWLL